LALSGGTAKSVAHIGVIKALDEAGIEVRYLSGTSGGSIVAALYAAGMSVGEMTELADGMGWRKLAGLTLPKLGLLSGDKIREFVVGAIGDIDFKDLSIPMTVVVADLTTGTKRIVGEGSVALACQASSSIPQIYSPVEIDGHLFIDGGLIEYLPVSALATMGEMFMIGVNLGLSEGLRKRPRHLLEVVMQVTGFVAQQNARISEGLADFVIRPPLERFSPFALDKAPLIIEEGYRETVRHLDELREALGRYGSPWNRLKRRFGGRNRDPR
jgi:NTE family protein